MHIHYTHRLLRYWEQAYCFVTTVAELKDGLIFITHNLEVERKLSLNQLMYKHRLVKLFLSGDISSNF